MKNALFIFSLTFLLLGIQTEANEGGTRTCEEKYSLFLTQAQTQAQTIIIKVGSQIDVEFADQGETTLQLKTDVVFKQQDIKSKESNGNILFSVNASGTPIIDDYDNVNSCGEFGCTEMGFEPSVYQWVCQSYANLDSETCNISQGSTFCYRTIYDWDAFQYKDM